MNKYKEYLLQFGGALGKDTMAPQTENLSGMEGLTASAAPQQQSMGAGAGAPLSDVGAGAQPPTAPIPAPAPPLDDQPEMADQEPVSFMDMAKQAPPEQVDEEIDKLEKQGVDLDKSYGEIMEIIGDRPDDKTTRREKGLLIMEFGMHLMANSAAGRHGGALGGAIGDAGINAIESYRQMKQQKKADQKEYDQTRQSIGMDKLRRRQGLEDDELADQRGVLQDERRREARKEDAYERITRRDEDGNLRQFSVNPYTGEEVDLGVVAPETVHRGAAAARPSVYQQRVEDLTAALTSRAGPDLSPEAQTFLEAEAVLIVQGQRDESGIKERAHRAASNELKENVSLSRRLDREGVREEWLRERAETLTEWIMQSSAMDRVGEINADSNMRTMMQNPQTGGFSDDERQALYEKLIEQGGESFRFRDRGTGQLYEVTLDGAITPIRE